MDATVAAWRRGERARLLAARQAVAPAARRQAGEAIAAMLDRALAEHPAALIGIYWPIRQEIDPLPWARRGAEAGRFTLCLPVVVTPKAPLEYWRWAFGEPLARGFWGIPVPARREIVRPDLVLAPLIGFDRAGFRLGYGGGYFDRTLAEQPRPRAIGIGYAAGALETIYPQPHDIPMDTILTERPGPEGT